MSTKNIYEIKENYAILKIYSKPYGLKEVLIDIEDVVKCQKINWHIEKDRKYIIRGNKKQNLWKLLLNYQGKLFINHKNKNEFDFRKNNLEIAKMDIIHKAKKENYYQHKNEFILKKDYCIIKIFSKVYGVKEVLINIEDYEKVKNYSWAITKKQKDKTFYVRTVRNYKNILLHRFIINAQKNEYIDHINHDGLDNRRCNLRIVTSNENSQNRLIKNKYIGVNKITNEKTIKWVAGITVNGQYIYLGRYKTEIEAIEARRQAELKYWGKEALKINDENRKRTELY